MGAPARSGARCVYSCRHGARDREQLRTARRIVFGAVVDGVAGRIRVADAEVIAQYAVRNLLVARQHGVDDAPVVSDQIFLEGRVEGPQNVRHLLRMNIYFYKIIYEKQH